MHHWVPDALEQQQVKGLGGSLPFHAPVLNPAVGVTSLQETLGFFQSAISHQPAVNTVTGLLSVFLHIRQTLPEQNSLNTSGLHAI